MVPSAKLSSVAEPRCCTLDIAEALDAQVVGDLDAIGAVLERDDPIVAERDQVED